MIDTILQDGLTEKDSQKGSVHILYLPVPRGAPFHKTPCFSRCPSFGLSSVATWLVSFFCFLSLYRTERSRCHSLIGSESVSLSSSFYLSIEARRFAVFLYPGFSGLTPKERCSTTYWKTSHLCNQISSTHGCTVYAFTRYHYFLSFLIYCSTLRCLRCSWQRVLRSSQ